MTRLNIPAVSLCLQHTRIVGPDILVPRKEMEILHMLNMWVFGEPVYRDGVQYDGKAVNVPMSNLHELSKSLDVKDLIARIARSHYTLKVGVDG